MVQVRLLLCLKLLEVLRQESRPYFYISTSMQSYKECLRGACKSLGVKTKKDDNQDSLHRSLYSCFEENSDNTLIILLDDAQEHSDKNLNRFRMLINYNIDGRYPIRLFLFGNPEFLERLHLEDMQPPRSTY